MQKDDHYNWHTDGQGCHLNARKSTVFHNKSRRDEFKTYSQANLLGTVRKISVSAILNDDYEGGELLFRYLRMKPL